MTLEVPPGPARTAPVEVLVCGSPDRGDDGAPIAAAALLHGQLPEAVRMRIVGGLDVDHLLSVPADAGFVIVDAATGLRPGQVVDLPLNELSGRRGEPRPRSSHTLAFSEVLGLAELIQGRPLQGRIVAIGGTAFGLGSPPSEPVAAAIPELVAAIISAIEAVRGSVRLGARS